jgi:hypothetical protein
MPPDNPVLKSFKKGRHWGCDEKCPILVAQDPGLFAQSLSTRSQFLKKLEVRP